MLTNPGADRVKAVRALSRRAGRRRAGLFVAEGPQSVREAVAHRPDEVRELFATPEAARRYVSVVDDARTAGIAVREVDVEVMRALVGGTGPRREAHDPDLDDHDPHDPADDNAVSPQGLLAVVRTFGTSLDAVLATRPRLVCVLAEVRDPGNAGTVLRAADAAGADAVVLTTGSVDVFGPKVVRSSAGSLFHLPVVTGVPVAEAVDRLRMAGLTVHAADGSGPALLGDVDLAPPHAWLLGNEAWGLPPEVRARCDDVVRVPIHGLAESLNLAMAATLCVYASAGAQRGSTATGPGRKDRSIDRLDDAPLSVP